LKRFFVLPCIHLIDLSAIFALIVAPKISGARNGRTRSEKERN
jgi:hypothetical protein